MQLTYQGMPLHPLLNFEHDTIQFNPETPFRELGEIKNICASDNKVMADIKAECSDGPIAKAPGSTIKIYWKSINADSCIVSPTGWTGKEGNVNYNLNETTQLILTCSGSQGVSTDYLNLYAEPRCGNGCCESNENCDNCADDCAYCDYDKDCEWEQCEHIIPNCTDCWPKPNVDIKANGSDGPITIITPDSATISWTSDYALSCTILKNGQDTGWTGTSGEHSSGPITEDPTIFEITCSNPKGSRSDCVEIICLDNEPKQLYCTTTNYYCPP